jgi:hypothetical protein
LDIICLSLKRNKWIFFIYFLPYGLYFLKQRYFYHKNYTLNVPFFSYASIKQNKNSIKIPRKHEPQQGKSVPRCSLQ